MNKMKTAILFFLALSLHAQTAIPTGMYYPSPFPLGMPTSFANILTISASTHQVEQVVSVPKSGNITGVVFLTNAVTTFNAGDTMAVSIETVDANYNATGTGYKSSTTASYAGAAAIATSTVYKATLGTQATSAVAGDVVAVRFIMSAYSAANFSLQVGNTAFAVGLPFVARSTDSGTNWTKSSGVPRVGFIYSDGSVTFSAGYPACFNTTVAMNNSAATYDQYGTVLTLPFGAVVSGIWVMNDLANTSSNQTAYLLNSAYSTISSATLAGTGPWDTTTPSIKIFRFAPTTLLPNTAYNIAVEATAASANNITQIVYQCQGSNTDLIAAFHGGTTWSAVRHTRGGAWGAVTTEKVPMGLIIDSIITPGSGASAQ